MSAHILIIADGRSPTAKSWINNIQALGYRISLVSTFPCQLPEGLHQFHVLPVALSRYSKSPTQSGTPEPTTQKPGRTLIRRFAPFLQSLRYVLGPLTLLRYGPAYRRLVADLRPDLVHALRIPFEGMLGSYTPHGIPFIAATWGNDLTLHAGGSPLMRTFTKRCLRRADGLTSDTQRDTRLARDWGLRDTAPALVVPGSGGLDLAATQRAEGFDPDTYGIPRHAPGDESGVEWVVNPRGLRPGSVHQDIFFAAIPRILVERPNTHFICPGLADSQQAQGWIAKYNIQANTHLLPKLPQQQLWSLLQQAQVFASPSSHDGTPNSLLEALACGCFPVVGEIESLREWVEGGVNGLLVDPRDPDALAEAVLAALEDDKLRASAAKVNQDLVRQRAAKTATLPQIDTFYRGVLK